MKTIVYYDCLRSIVWKCLTTLYITMIDSDKIAKSQNIIFSGFLQIFWGPLSPVDARLSILGIWDLATGLDIEPCPPSQTGAVRGPSHIPGVKHSFLVLTPPFNGLFYMPGLYWDPSFSEILFMFGTDCCDIVAQLFVCCLQGVIVVLEDFFGTGGSSLGNSLGPCPVSSVKHVSFRSIFWHTLLWALLYWFHPVWWDWTFSHEWYSQKLSSNTTWYWVDMCQVNNLSISAIKIAWEGDCSK